MSASEPGVNYSAHLAEKAIPGMVADGKFGQDVVVTKQDIAPVGGFQEDHWMSHTFKVALELHDTKNDVRRAVHLIAKYPIAMLCWSDSPTTWKNEEVVYRQLVPFFEGLWADSSAEAGSDEPLGLFPKCYLVNSGDTGSEPPLIIMEDLTTLGYRMASSKAGLDAAHVHLALRTLGKLHALSYAGKARRKNDFLHAARKLRESQYVEERRDMMHGFLTTIMERGLRRLAARGHAGDAGVDAATVQALESRFARAFDAVMETTRTEEPLSVVVHGDFCRNNVMFKYDEATGKPVEMVFFDFQTSKFCPPAVDLAFFLFLNTTPSQRSVNWDDFFVAYYDGLTTALRRLLSSGPDMSPTMEIPSLAAVKADFARHALYGYAICSFFLPVVQSAPGDKVPSNEDMTVLAETIPDRAEAGRAIGGLFNAVGGEGADDTLADLLLEFVERGIIGI